MADFDLVRATVLALIQGFTEFLPISSSAHLIFPSALLGWEDQGLAFDVAVHLGTLLAVILYFRQDIYAIFTGWCRQVFKRQDNPQGRLGWMIILATVPLVLAGLLMQDIVDTYLRSTLVIATTTIFFGLLLWGADLKSDGTKNLQSLNWQSYLLIGLAQIMALIPGTSRSGVTMTAALFCGLNRQEASRFSFLLSIPAIAGAAILLLLDLLEIGTNRWLELGYGMVLSAIVAYLCIHYFLKLINQMGFMPFVVYRLMLGIALFMFFI